MMAQPGVESRPALTTADDHHTHSRLNDHGAHRHARAHAEHNHADHSHADHSHADHSHAHAHADHSHAELGRDRPMPVVLREPGLSLLRLSALQRVAGALVFSLLLWATVLWALRPL